MLDEKFITSQRKKIAKTIERLKFEIAHNKKKIELGTNPDDDASEFEQFEEKQALIKIAEKDLSELKRAIKKIDEGKYGICAEGGEEIERGRLEAYPAAVYCVTHAKRR